MTDTAEKLFQQILWPLLATIDIDSLRTQLEEMSGECEFTTLAGTRHRLLSRSTYNSEGIELAARYLEDRYSRLGIGWKRQNYSVEARPIFPQDVCGPNVIGEILGDVTPSKIVVVGSHFDATAGRMRESEDVTPGADDNATGTIAALEVARIVMALKALGVKFANTICFANFSGEEQQRAGSIGYVRTLKAPPRADVIAMFQLEMMGYTGDGSRQVDILDDGRGNGSEELAAYLIDTAKAYGLDLKTVYRNEHLRGMRDSDHTTFVLAGYRGVCICEDCSNLGLNKFMHSTSDRVGKLTMDFYADIIRMLIPAIVHTAGMILPE